MLTSNFCVILSFSERCIHPQTIVSHQGDSYICALSLGLAKECVRPRKTTCKTPDIRLDALPTAITVPTNINGNSIYLGY